MVLENLLNARDPELLLGHGRHNPSNLPSIANGHEGHTLEKWEDYATQEMVAYLRSASPCDDLGLSSKL